MTNPNLSSLLFVSLLCSSLSFVSICNADASHETAGEPHFGYTEGALDEPTKWESLSPDWKVCSSGKQQSPINIDVKQAQVQPGDLKKVYKDAPAKLINSGHNIAVEWEGDAGGIEIDGTAYRLIRCHWHIPSEHTIDGKRFDAELHVVHSTDQKQVAVIGCLYTIGLSDPFVANLTEKIKVLRTRGVDLGRISASSIRCGSKKNFRYIGSLTTPPCTEGVIWTIGEEVRPVSQDQIQLLKEALGYDNPRPLQVPGERPVWQIDLPEET